MAAVTTQSIVQAGTTPAPITPTASDTIAAGQFGPNGVILRCITAGTTTTVTVQDPGVTQMGNAPTPPGVAMPATGSRMISIPTSAINQSSQQATVGFSGALTGVTYEAYRY